jgi:lysozyme
MNLIDQIKRHEGCVLHVYPDQFGIPTAGVGHNCEAHHLVLKIGDAITQDQADRWLVDDLAQASRDLQQKFQWTDDLDSVRRDVLVNMVFNMGISKFSGFHRTLAMVEAGNYEGGSEAMLESAWANQVGKEPPNEKEPYGGRAYELSQQMKKGAYQDV